MATMVYDDEWRKRGAQKDVVMIDSTPSPNGPDGAPEAAQDRPGHEGRDTRGRFTRGNSGGPGNPLGARAARFRAAIMEAVSEDDLRQVIEALVRQAKSGDLGAIRELLVRTVGRPLEADLLERIEDLEQALS